MKKNKSLRTDYYELTMAQTYFKQGKEDSVAYFDLFFRKNPFEGGYTLSGGLDETIEYIKNLTTHDENDVVEKISKIMTGYYIEDWQPSDIETYMNSIKEVIQEVKNGNDKSSKESNRILLIDGNEKIEKYLTSNDNISVIGNTMKNNIEEIISEYGNSLSEEEKISVLVDIIKNYM